MKNKTKEKKQQLQPRKLFCFLATETQYVCD